MFNLKPGINFVKFFATWCGSCKVLDKTINNISPDYPSVNFINIDADEQPILCKSYKIKNIPTIIIFKDDKEIYRLVGNVSQTQLKQSIEDALEK
jgi:thioredoxin 1